MDRAALEKLSRDDLITHAEHVGVERARILTRPELIDEILLTTLARSKKSDLRRARGFFGLARDLISKVIEKGLHLPDAAERLKSLVPPPPTMTRPSSGALPTVTLAEIYASQGHTERAVETLERVLAHEPEHSAAHALLQKLRAQDYVAPPKPDLPPEQDVAVAATVSDEDDEAFSVAAPDSAPVLTKRSAPPRAQQAMRAAAVAEPAPPEPAPVRSFKESLAIAKAATTAPVAPVAKAAPPVAKASPPVAKAAPPIATTLKPPVAPAAAVVEVLPPSDPIPSSQRASFSVPKTMQTIPVAPLAREDAAVDAVDAVPLDNGRLLVHYNVGIETHARLIARERNIVLRVLRFFAHPEGTTRARTDLAISDCEGHVLLSDLPAEGCTRVALGWVDEVTGTFHAVAHAPLLEGAAPRLSQWLPSGSTPVMLDNKRLHARPRRTVSLGHQPSV